MANINKNIIMQAGAAVANAANKAAGLPAATPEPGSIISVIQLVNGGREIGPSTLAHFTESVRNKLLSLLVSMEPIQSGSGDPSPDNVRPITGRTGAHVYVSPTSNVADAATYSVDWSTQAGTVYHGTVDPVAGQLTVDWVMYTFDGSEAWTASATPHRFSTKLFYLPYPIATQPITEGATQNVLTSVFGECVYTNADGVGYVVKQAGGDLFVVNEPSATTVNDIKDIVTGMQFCYELATPLTYQLTGTDIVTLVGDNYIWSDSGDVTITE